MTFQISPHIHLAWPSTPKFSCKVDVRWLFKSHLGSMQDDIWKVYKGKILQIFIIWPWDIEEVTSNSKVLTRGACEMTFQISPCVHLAWPSTPKFSRKVDTRWLFKCHLASTWDDIWKVYKEKILQIFIIWPWDIKEVTSNTKFSCDMTFQLLPRIHLAWWSVPLLPCEMTFEKYIRGNLADIHHSALGHRRGNIYSDISHMKCMQDDFSNVISRGHEMRFEKYIRGNLADIHHLALGHQRGNIYLDISHARCTWDDFSNLTLHPSSMAKCPLHHPQSHLK